ncbi:MAG TPA: FlgD immunoglobulin-like domain containing protein, partial [Candidatus Eisenbacteria bacterium]|nr:FlgD immunoglobulin-like domain containing protein [Candidatus Eisenbacteria bacterium]
FFTNPVSLQVILSSPPTPPTSDVAEGVSGSPKSRLAQNSPNPFNPSTTIRFALQNRDHVRLSVYSASGRLVSVLENSDLDAGSHSISWHGLDREGHPVGSGVYVYRLVTGSGFEDSKRMVLVR